MMLALAMLFIPRGATAFDVDSLLVRSVGGAAAVDTLQRVSSYYAHGFALVNGQPGEITEIIVPPDKLYLELSLQQFKIVQVLDGENAWQQDLNGRVADLSGFEKRELLRTAYFDTYSYVLKDRMAGGHAYLGDTSFGGLSYHKIAFYPLHQDTVIALFDEQTGLRYQTISMLDNIRTITTSENYLPISGVLVPMRQKAIAENAPISIEFVMDSVAFNVPVDASQFDRPGEAKRDFHFPAGQTSVTIPFEYINGHMYVTATINGRRKARFILDSGASATIFHSGTIGELNLPVVGSMPARGVAGFESAQLVRTDSLAIGPLTLYNQIGGSIDLSILEVQRRQGDRFGGVIGYDFLSRFPVMIDYQKSQLTVFDPASFVVPEGSHEIPFDLTMQIPTIDASIAGVTGKFLIDLGNAFGLILHPEFVLGTSLKSSLRPDTTKEGAVGGLGGGVRAAYVTAPTVQFGDIVLDSLPVMISGSSEGLTGSVEIDGNIGNQLLQRFVLLFDYSRQRLHLYPSK